MENTRISNRAGILLGMLAACLTAFVLAMSMTSTAEAAGTGPYPGYKSSGNYYNAGYISMETYDSRGVKSGYDSFTIWSGNSMAYNSKSQYVKASKTFKKLKGMSYNKKTNTLVLNNVNASKYTLYVYGMGKGFTIKVKGNSSLAGIYSSAVNKYDSNGLYTNDYYPSSVKIDGTGKLVLNKNQYNGSAVVIDARYTRSTLTITQSPTVKMWAYGTSNVISVSSTTVSSDSSAVKLKGNLSEKLVKASVKVPGYTIYKTDSVALLDSSNAGTTTCYIKNGKLYRNTNPSSTDIVLERVVKVKSTNIYAPTGQTITVKALPSKTKTVKVHYGSTVSATKLNKRTYYGVTAGGSYYDTKARQYYYAKWNICKKVSKINGVTYVSVVKKNVGNNKNLPKGYSGSKDTVYGDSYSYVVRNPTLIASGF